MKRYWMLFTVLLALVGSAALTSTPALSAIPGVNSRHCNLDEGFAIDDGVGLSGELRAFLGVFDGKWEGGLPSTLIVYRVKRDGEKVKARAFYSWAKYPRFRIRRPGCVRVRGTIKDGELRFTAPNSTRFTYSLAGGMLVGQFRPAGNPTRSGIFSRLAGAGGATVVSAPVPQVIPGTDSNHCNLDESFAITDDADLPDEQRAFLGIFYGKWGDKLPHTLIIYRVRRDGKKVRVRGLYTWSKYPPWNIDYSGCVHFRGTIKDGELRFTLNNGARLVYSFDGNMLAGEYTLGDKRTTVGVFSRVGEPAG